METIGNYQWYNFKTKEYEAFYKPTTDEEAMRFIPDDRASQALYKLYREHKGMEIMEALRKVLEANVGKPKRKNLFTRFLDWYSK